MAMTMSRRRNAAVFDVVVLLALPLLVPELAR
jgi:hypothetical protein